MGKTKKPYPIDHYLKRVTDFYAQHGRVPRINECEHGQSTSKHLMKRYGTWDKVIQAALGKKGMHHDWTQDEIGEIIKNKYAEINRLPMSKDFTPAENSLITKHCAGVNFAAEKFLGNSVRVEIMRCIDQLMPSGVDAPTTQEIYFSMKQKGFTLNIDEIRGVLNFTVRQQYLENGRYDRTVWWKLTPAGKEFLKQFKGKKDGNRT